MQGIIIRLKICMRFLSVCYKWVHAVTEFIYISVFNTFVQVPAGSTGIQVTQGNAFCFLSKYKHNNDTGAR